MKKAHGVKGQEFIMALFLQNPHAEMKPTGSSTETHPVVIVSHFPWMASVDKQEQNPIKDHQQRSVTCATQGNCISLTPNLRLIQKVYRIKWWVILKEQFNILGSLFVFILC